MSPSASTPETLLLDALRATAWPLHPAAQSKLQAHVCAFVDDRRNEGWSVERVIIALKLIADEAGLFRGDPRGIVRNPPRDGARLVAVLVSWCIDHYYRPLPETADG
jgi:hypothetical protein